MASSVYWELWSPHTQSFHLFNPSSRLQFSLPFDISLTLVSGFLSEKTLVSSIKTPEAILLYSRSNVQKNDFVDIHSQMDPLLVDGHIG